MRLKVILRWNDWNKEHIKKHKVTKKEVEEAFSTKPVKIKTYKNRLLVLGKTKSGRLLTIIVSDEKRPFVISARDISRKERRIYYEQTKTD